MMSLPNYRKLNNYDFESDYDHIITYKTTGETPRNYSESQTKRFVRKYRKHFRIIDNNIFFNHLQVIRKKDITEYLQPIFDNPQEGFGHGITQFYNIVANKYLNVTRKDVENFLKQQMTYQLTFKPRKRSEPVKKYNKSHQAYALDLIDIHRYSTTNKNNNFILTMIDVFSQECWLRPLKNKNAEDIYKALKPILEKNKPKQILLDNGTEFKGINKDMFKELKIKVNYTPSHTPQANIEKFNGQIRQILSKLFVQQKNTNWILHLNDIQENINNYNSLPVNQQKRARAVEKRKENPPKETKPLFETGNVVRISQHAFEPHVRSEIKKGLQKYIHVKFSIHLFKIFKIYKPYKSNSLPYYSVKHIESGDVISNDNNDKPRRFREIDLLLVDNVIGQDLTQSQNDRLNGLHYEEPQQPSKRTTRSGK